MERNGAQREHVENDNGSQYSGMLSCDGTIDEPIVCDCEGSPLAYALGPFDRLEDGAPLKALLDGDELGREGGTCEATFVGNRLGDGLGIALRKTDGLYDAGL